MLRETFHPWRVIALSAALLGSAPLLADDKPAPERAEKPALRFTLERHRATKAGDEVTERTELTRAEATSRVYPRIANTTLDAPDPELRAAIALFNRGREGDLAERLKSEKQVVYERIAIEEPPAAAPRVAYRFSLVRFRPRGGEVVERKDLTRAEALVAARSVPSFFGQDARSPKSTDDAALWEAIATYNLSLGGAAMRRSPPEVVMRIEVTEVPAENVEQ